MDCLNAKIQNAAGPIVAHAASHLAGSGDFAHVDCIFQIEIFSLSFFVDIAYDSAGVVGSRDFAIVDEILASGAVELVEASDDAACAVGNLIVDFRRIVDAAAHITFVYVVGKTDDAAHVVAAFNCTCKA